MREPGQSLIVTGVGLHSSLGGLTQATAAFRAGLSRARDLTDWGYVDEQSRHEHLLQGHSAAGLPDGFTGVARLVKLAAAGLADLARNLEMRTIEPQRLGLVLALPDDLVFGAAGAPDAPQRSLFLARLRAFAPFPINAAHCEACCEGRIGTITALRRASDILHSGEIDACVVGAIDSLLEPDRLLRLIQARKVKTVDNPVGLVPGEAACFVLLERPSAPSANGAAVALHRPCREAVPPPSRTADPDEPEAPPTGKELSGVLEDALSAIPHPPSSGAVYSDLDGDPVKAMDLATALQRTPALRELTSWRHEIPALSFGNTGTAGILLALSLAIGARRRGHLSARDILVVSSDSQSRAAFVASVVAHG